MAQPTTGPTGPAHVAPPAPLRLREVAHRLRGLTSAVEVRGDADVCGVTADSRAVRPGWLFCARRGEHSDGHDHAADALRRGAAALLVERWLPVAVPQVRVAHTRPLIGHAAAMVHGNPSLRLATVAVTGTNGKTTTAFLARHALLAGERRTAAIGTLGTTGPAKDVPHALSAMTTPGACDLQATLGAMVADGFDSVVIEASSQGLDQDRLAGCDIALAVWLNLSPEHLDYHGTVEQYYAAKARLFDPSLSARGLVCIDDQWGRRLAAQARIPITTFGRHPHADVRFDVVSTGIDGTQIRIRDGVDDVVVRSGVIGSVNAANIAAAYLVGKRSGVGPADAVRGIAEAPAVPGRFQLLEAGQPFHVVIDYAHTPDALEKLLDTARTLAAPGGEVHLVLGCRGGRDRYKRPGMGRAAASGAHHVVFTTDHPGAERPAAIVTEMLVGALEVPERHVDIELDRSRAIAAAIRAAHPGDVVVMSGRGPERGDIRWFGPGRTDEELAAGALAHRGYLARAGGQPVWAATTEWR
jgi:UDP-N-acetylmuramoyl-L-alanyl-D-glutamate--2,6-diaminopimelate ligase